MMIPSRAKISKFALAAIKGITVEPVAILFFSGFAVYHTAQIPALYYKICYSEFGRYMPDLDCANTQFDKNHRYVETEVQKQSATWSMYILLAKLIPALPASLLLSAWGDLAGRKTNILIAFAASIMAVFVFLLQMCVTDLPLWPMIPIFALLGLTGMMSVLANSLFQYISDVTINKELLVVRMTLVGSCLSVGQIIGSAVSGVLISTAGYNWTFIVAQLLLTIGMLYALWRIDMVPPAELIKRKEDKRDARAIQKNKLKEAVDDKHAVINDQSLNVSESTITLPAKKPVPAKTNLFQYVKKLLEDIKLSYTVKREGNRRLYIWLLITCTYIIMMTELGMMNVLMLFMLGYPLHFTPLEIGYIQSVGAFLGIPISLAVASICKWLKWSDLAVLQISCISNLARLILYGLSQHKWMIWLATIIGCVNHAGFPAIQTFLCKLGRPNESGKFIAGVGIVSNLAMLTSTGLFSSIYQATIESYSGTVFLFAAGMQLITLGIVGWVQWDYAKHESSTKAEKAQELHEQHEETANGSKVVEKEGN